MRPLLHSRLPSWRLIVGTAATALVASLSLAFSRPAVVNLDGQRVISDVAPVTAGTGSHRALPDLSTDADPFSGYLLYEPSFTAIGQPALQGGWGGTSYVAPQLNGSAAVIDSALGHRVGFWNPSIYRFARSSGSPFTPLQQAGTGNDNDYFSGTPGDLYNESTGLGIPNLSRLAADFKA